MHVLTSHFFWIWIISFGSILCMLLRPRGIREAVWIGTGAIFLVAFQLLPLRSALHAIAKGSDVYLFLTGMMLLAELARHEGVFDWIADIAVRHARRSASRLFLLIYITGTVVTALLSNDATAVVLTPAILAAVRRARVEPRPHLLACALIANAASFLLPVSNPANLVVYADRLPPLGSWLRIFLFPSVVSLAATYACLRLLCRNPLSSQIQSHEDAVALSQAGRFALGGLIFASVVLLTASGLGIGLGIPTCAAAVASLILVSIKDRGIFRRAALDIAWSILPLVAGLFVLVEALNTAGMLRLIQGAFHWMAREPKLIGYLAAAGGAGVLSNIMNNLPVGLATGAALQAAPQLSHAVLIGVNLGPNLSVTGSLATILWLIALRREEVEITPWQFFKTGLIVMPAALFLSVLALWVAA